MPQAPETPPLYEMETEWGHVLSAAWLVLWRSWAAALVVGAVFYLLLGLQESAFLAFLSWFSVTFLAVWMMLGKRYREFRIAVIPHAFREEKEETEPGFDRVLSIWWLFAWRSTVIFALLYFPAILALAALVPVFVSLAIPVAVLGALAALVLLGLTALVYIWVMRMTFNKNYAAFRLAVVDPDGEV